MHFRDVEVAAFERRREKQQHTQRCLKINKKKIQAIAFNALTIKKNYKLILLVVGFVQRAYNFFAHQ